MLTQILIPILIDVRATLTTHPVAVRHRHWHGAPTPASRPLTLSVLIDVCAPMHDALRPLEAQLVFAGALRLVRYHMLYADARPRAHVCLPRRPAPGHPPRAAPPRLLHQTRGRICPHRCLAPRACTPPQKKKNRRP
ncbi:hypothetical protein GGX14DRAFT_556987 [Mycena pura]|uniref:Uncharacterized protein n=1 Tax=Mycena pura TaxID=153505 RepID=A0AAD7E2N3_9AGAR|nr:hypothetical protein GGX14DRAFT_556987 [Mycena pura]